MELFRYRNLFIRAFFFSKLFLIALLFLLSATYAYRHEQMKEIFLLITPTLSASLIIFLNYLRKQRNLSEIPKGKVLKTEVLIVFCSLAFSVLFIIINLLSLQVEDTAFANMKSWIATVEAVLGGVLGWVISDLDHSKEKSGNETA